MTDMPPEQRFDERLREIVQSTRSSVLEGERLAHLLADFRMLHPRPSLLKRAVGWLSVPHRLPAPAIALAAAVILVQGIALVTLRPGRQANPYRSETIPCEDGPRVRVVFKPDARQAEIVILLRKVEAAVTAGPSETGELWLRLPRGRSVREALAQMRSSAIVDEAIIVAPNARECGP